MKKFVVIVLLCSLFFTILGYHFVFRLQLSEAKAEMTQHLYHIKDLQNITQFTFSKEEATQLDWENKTEFAWKGDMYDILDMHATGNEIIINCVSDKKETSLLAEYRKLFKKDNPSDKSSSSTLLKLMTANFIPAAPIAIGNPLRYRAAYFPFFIFHFPFHYSSIIKPPPEHFC